MEEGHEQAAGSENGDGKSEVHVALRRYYQRADRSIREQTRLEVKVLTPSTRLH